MNIDRHYDAIVIGGGPVGLTAGIYLSRARMKTLIISEGTAIAALAAAEYLNMRKKEEKQLISN
jgi:thioredoxin reductase